jgi:hypothetical protein
MSKLLFNNITSEFILFPTLKDLYTKKGLAKSEILTIIHIYAKALWHLILGQFIWFVFKEALLNSILIAIGFDAFDECLVVTLF